MANVIKDIIVKKTEAWRLRVLVRDMSSPSELRNVEFIGETYKDGVLIDTSTYQFFLTDQELEFLSKELMP